MGNLHAWRDKAPKIVGALAAKCGADKVAPADLLGPDGLGFGALDPLCAAFGGGVDSIASLGACVERAVACRIEAALAVAMPRAGDLLAAAGALSDLCIPASSGDLSGLPNPKSDGAAATACQSAIAKAGATTLAHTIATAQGCVALVRKCEATSTSPESCAPSLAPKCAALFDKLTLPGKGVFAKQDAVIGKACAAVPEPDLLTTPGLGFTLDGERCAALGVTSLAGAADAAECVLRAQRCAAADVLDLGAPRGAAVLAAVGQRPAGGDGLSCPAFDGPPSP